jgi:hypothetical protein
MLVSTVVLQELHGELQSCFLAIRQLRPSLCCFSESSSTDAVDLSIFLGHSSTSPQRDRETLLANRCRSIRNQVDELEIAEMESERREIAAMRISSAQMNIDAEKQQLEFKAEFEHWEAELNKLVVARD